MSSRSSSDSPDHERLSQRERTLRAGKLYHGPTMLETDCTILDVSEGGARVRLPSGAYLTPPVWLLEIRSGMAAEATVAWAQYPLVGLSFTSRCHVDEAPGVEGRILKRAWTALRV